MNTKSQKQMAAKIMKCGVSRVRIKQAKEIEEALTRNDIRDLIKKDLITKKQKKGTSRAAAKKTLKQKSKGRRRGRGSRKGKKHAGNPKKGAWINSVRPLRKLLRELRDYGQIGNQTYRKMYLRIGGGFFRNKKHLLLFLKEHELLKKKVSVSKKTKVAKK